MVRQPSLSTVCATTAHTISIHCSRRCAAHGETPLLRRQYRTSRSQLTDPDWKPLGAVEYGAFLRAFRDAAERDLKPTAYGFDQPAEPILANPAITLQDLQGEDRLVVRPIRCQLARHTRGSHRRRGRGVRRRMAVRPPGRVGARPAAGAGVLDDPNCHCGDSAAYRARANGPQRRQSPSWNTWRDGSHASGSQWG